MPNKIFRKTYRNAKFETDSVLAGLLIYHSGNDQGVGENGHWTLNETAFEDFLNATLSVSMERKKSKRQDDNAVKVTHAFGSALETLQQFLSRGIINWGKPVSSILEDGMLLIQQARATETSGLVSVLLEGPPNSGKTALAAQLAKNSDFPFVKVCSPEEMVGFTETARCLHIRKVFDDAYRSTLSCILVDNIERLLDYGPIGPRYCNLTLQALLVLLKKQPPPGKKLLILCTSSRRQVLEDMEMLSAFTAIMHVPNLKKAEELLNVLEASEVFSAEDLRQINREVHGKSIFIGIKKLLALIDMARQTEEGSRVMKLITKLKQDGALKDPNVSKVEDLLNVLAASEVFSAEELKQINRQVSGKIIFIAMDKLLALIDMVRQTEERFRVIKLITKLREDGALKDPTKLKEVDALKDPGLV